MSGFKLTHTNPKRFTIEHITGSPDGNCSGLVAVAISDTIINLTWVNGSTNETGISIERSTDGINYTQIYNALAGATSYSNTGRADDTLYYYRVRAVRGSFYSSYSNVASATTYSSDFIDYLDRVTADGGTNLLDDISSSAYLNVLMNYYKDNGLFDAATLLMIPSARKASKLYSVLPSDGSGDFVYTRSGSRWDRNNYGVYTEEADNIPGLDWDGTQYRYASELAVSNLFSNPSAPATQTVTVLNSTVYSVSCKGSGSVTLSGAATGVVTESTPLIITTGSTSLICTCSGTLTNVQVENGLGTITSPIYGGAGTHARVKDVAQLTGAGAIIGQTEGTIYIEIDSSQVYPVGAGQLFCLTNASGYGTDRMNCYITRVSGGVTFEFDVITGGVLQTSIASATFVYNPEPFKIAIRYKANDIAVFINGILVGTDTSTSIPACTIIDLGHLANASQLSDYIKAFALCDTGLTNQELSDISDSILDGLDTTSLSNFKAAKALLDGGSNTRYNINFHGDSITEGVTAGTTAQYDTLGFVGLLRTRFASDYSDCGFGIRTSYSPTYNPFWTFGSGWYNIGYGFTALCKQTATLGATGSFTFVGTELSLITLAGSDTATFGAFTVQIDGGAVESFTNVISGATRPRLLSIASGLTDASHTVSVVNSSGKTLTIMACYVTKGRGFVCNMVGQTGTTSEKLTEAAPLSSIACAELLNPILTVIGYITNDMTSALPIATFKANIQAMITSAKKSGDVLLIADNGRIDRTITQQEPYVTALSELASDNDCLFVNIHRRWEMQGTFGKNMADVLHPNIQGHWDIANVLYKILTS